MNDDIIISNHTVNTINYSVTSDGSRYYFNDGTSTITDNLQLIVDNIYIFDLSSVGILNVNSYGHPFYISTL